MKLSLSAKLPTILIYGFRLFRVRIDDMETYRPEDRLLALVSQLFGGPRVELLVEIDYCLIFFLLSRTFDQPTAEHILLIVVLIRHKLTNMHQTGTVLCCRV